MSTKQSPIEERQNILFIKLGLGGEWEKDCIETDGTIRLGFNEASHELCLNKE